MACKHTLATSTTALRKTTAPANTAGSYVL